MKAILGLALVAAMASSALAQPAKKTTTKKAAAAAEKPAAKPSIYYEFKGARLGMTIAEVKALPSPARTGSEFASRYTSYGPNQFLCSTDARPDGKPVSFYRSEVETALNVVVCKHVRFMTMKIAGTRISMENSFIPIGVSGTDDVTYKFLDGRLYSIEITGNAIMLSEVLDGLTAKFGQPDEVIKDTTQNKAGATFPHTEHIWTNPAATLTVESPWSRIDNMHVSYLTKEGAARWKAKSDELNPPASKM